MRLSRVVCRALVRALPRTVREGPLQELPELVDRLVAEARLEHGWTAATWTAVRELSAVAGICARERMTHATRHSRSLFRRLTRRLGPDSRLLILLALRDRASTVTTIVLIAVVSGVVGTAATLAYGIRTEAMGFASSDRLSWIWAEREWATQAPLVSDVHLSHLREEADSFEGFAGLWLVSGRVSGTGRPVHADVARASANFFDLLGVEPALGRLFREGDDRPGAPWVAVLTHEFWQRELGGDPDVVGRRLVVGVPEMEVVGVLPEGFDFPLPEALGPYGVPQIWLPTRFRPEVGALAHDVQAILSLRMDGVSAAEARIELETLGTDLDQNTYAGRGFSYAVEGLPSGRVPALARAVGIVAFALLGLLSIAAVNIASLSRISGSRRSAAFEVLQLVGGSRSRMMSLVWLEALVRGVVGAVLGLVVSALSVWWIARAPGLPGFLPDVMPNPWMFGVLVGAPAALLALAAGASAAVRLSIGRPRDTGRLRPARRTADRTAIVFQVALASALMVGAFTLQRAVDQALWGAAGFQPQGLVTLQVYPMPDDYPDGPSRDRLLIGLIEGLEHHEDIRRVSAGSALPLTGGSTQVPAGRAVPGRRVNPAAFSVAEWTGFDAARWEGDLPERSRLVDLNVAAPGFFSVLGAELSIGRGFTSADTVGSPLVAVIGQGLAASLWPTGSPVGDSLWVVGAWRRVVGVMPETALHDLRRRESPQAWVPHAQVLAGRMSIVLETDLSPEEVQERAIGVMAEIDDRVPLAGATTVPTLVRAQTSEERLLALIVTVFSIVSLLLATCATYAALAIWVRSRQKEIAVRLALGGDSRGIGLLVARETILPSLQGAVLGALAFLVVERLADPLSVVGGSVRGPGLYLAAVGICVIAGCASGVLPGINAARTDPVTLLDGPA